MTTSSTELSTLPCQTYFQDSEYSVSKAALNALTVQYSLAYAAQNFTFLAITPGVSLPSLPHY